jgi:ABC-type Na+ efflux pump permease subunit
MSRLRSVAWREFKHTALTKAFIIGAIVFPLIMWAVFPLLAALTQRTVPPFAGTLALIDPTGEVAAAAHEEFDEQRLRAQREAAIEQTEDLIRAAGTDPAAAVANPDVANVMTALSEPPVNITVEVFGDDTELTDLKRRVRAGEFVAVATVDPALLDAEQAKGASVGLFVPSNIKSDHTRILKRRLGDSVVRARALRSGQDADLLRDLVRRPSFESIALTDDGSEARESIVMKEILPFAFLMLLWITAFTSGQYLLTTTIEEKSNKVMEVLLSAVSPLQLMAGKILGQGLVALVMLVMYGGLLFGAIVIFATLDLIPPLHLVYFALYFVMAYFYIAAAMAAVGSAVNDLHEAQSLMGPVMMVLVLAPLASGFVGSQDPNGTIATVFSFIPPVTPFAMITRITAGQVPFWQIGLSLVVGYAGVVAGLWCCAKIFRIGVLMQGKPPSPMEMLRWIRYS